jgi:hypothetical protein
VTVKATSITESSSSVTDTVIVTNGSVELDAGHVIHQSASQPATAASEREADQYGAFAADHQQHRDRWLGRSTVHSNQHVWQRGRARGVLRHHREVQRRPGTFAAVLSITDSSPDCARKITLAASSHEAMATAVRNTLARESLLTAPRPTGASPVGTRVLHLIDSTRAVANGGRREGQAGCVHPSDSRGLLGA